MPETGKKIETLWSIENPFVSKNKTFFNWVKIGAGGCGCGSGVTKERSAEVSGKAHHRR